MNGIVKGREQLSVGHRLAHERAQGLEMVRLGERFRESDHLKDDRKKGSLNNSLRMGT